MGKLGTGITLLVVGAMLTFALNIDIPGVGKDALGIILMLGGLLVLGLWLVTENQRRHRHAVVEQEHVVEESVPVVEEDVPPARTRRRRRYL